MLRLAPLRRLQQVSRPATRAAASAVRCSSAGGGACPSAATRAASSAAPGAPSNKEQAKETTSSSVATTTAASNGNGGGEGMGKPKGGEAVAAPPVRRRTMYPDGSDITYKDAQVEFLLADADLIDLPYTVFRNRFHRMVRRGRAAARSAVRVSLTSASPSLLLRRTRRPCATSRRRTSSRAARTSGARCERWRWRRSAGGTSQCDARRHRPGPLTWTFPLRAPQGPLAAAQGRQGAERLAGRDAEKVSRHAPPTAANGPTDSSFHAPRSSPADATFSTASFPAARRPRAQRLPRRRASAR